MRNNCQFNNYVNVSNNKCQTNKLKQLVNRNFINKTVKNEINNINGSKDDDDNEDLFFIFKN